MERRRAEVGGWGEGAEKGVSGSVGVGLGRGEKMGAAV